MEREYKDSGIEWIGRIPKEWETTKLFNLCTIKGRIGWNGLRSDEFKEKSFAYLVTGQDFVSSDINWHNCYQIDKNRYDEDPFIQLSNGDILITKDGTIGKIAKVSNMDKPACLNSGIFVLKQRGESFVQDYLYWYLVSPILLAYNSYINSGGTTIMHLYQNVFERFPLLIPPLPEQQRIASYLDKKCGEIDGLIELQEQMIAQLTDYKQSVITEAVTKGLNPDAELVPSGIDWIGDVPKGWKVSKAKYFVAINNGSDPQLEGDVPVYGSGATSFKTCGEFKDGPAVLIGRKGATLHIPHYIEGKYWNVDTAFDVKSKGKMELRYYYYLAICFDYKYYISQTTLPGMAQSSYYNMKLPIPPLSEQQAIASYLDTKCSEIDTLIALKQLKIETLKAYKKSVIFEAVTGKTTIA